MLLKIIKFSRSIHPRIFMWVTETEQFRDKSINKVEIKDKDGNLSYHITLS